MNQQHFCSRIVKIFEDHRKPTVGWGYEAEKWTHPQIFSSTLISYAIRSPEQGSKGIFQKCLFLAVSRPENCLWQLSTPKIGIFSHFWPKSIN